MVLETYNKTWLVLDRMVIKIGLTLFRYLTNLGSRTILETVPWKTVLFRRGGGCRGGYKPSASAQEVSSRKLRRRRAKHRLGLLMLASSRQEHLSSRSIVHCWGRGLHRQWTTKLTKILSVVSIQRKKSSCVINVLDVMVKPTPSIKYTLPVLHEYGWNAIVPDYRSFYNWPAMQGVKRAEE